jgi:hypothetical protein
VRTVHARPATARPQHRTGLGSAAHNRPRALGALRACTLARLAVVHRGLPDDKAVHRCRPERWGVAWHGVAQSGGCGQTMSRSTRHAARGVALPPTAYGKMSTGSIHGPWRTFLTWSQALNRSEEGRRQRGGAHRRGRRPKSSMAVKVGEWLWALVKLWDLRIGREEG